MNNNTDIIQIIGILEKIIFKKDEWGILSVSINEVIQGDPSYDKYGNITVKGVIPILREGNSYTITAELVVDDKYGDQYNIISICNTIPFDEDDHVKQRIFLESLFTPNQIKEMYAALDNPFHTLKEKDSVALVQVKGCGMTTANRWMKKFEEAYNIGLILIELQEYHLTNKMVEKLLDTYKSPELVVAKVIENPYILCTEVEGIGWIKADNMALSGGIEPYGTVRVGAYIKYYLNTKAYEGFSWITADELLGAILDNIGEEVPDENITLALQELIENNVLWWNEDKTHIGLQYFRNIEHRVAEELIRIRDSESYFKYSDWEKTVVDLEIEQGWTFTDEQKRGIQIALEQNLTVIQGCAGTGKSSLVAAFLRVLDSYSYVQCALSGRAASRMSEITGQEGYTIHRLLGFPKGPNEKGCFVFHDMNPLEFDIYIIDEISMIDAKLFHALLRAIPSGSKVICLGDPGQLEAIGCGNVAYDMIRSNEITSIMLTKIHRQAAASAIITESLKIREGTQIISRDWVGTETRGKLQDLTLNCYSDMSNTFYNVMASFSKAFAEKDFDILETQVIVPLRERGAACTYELNNIIQEMCNPDKGQRSMVMNNFGKPYVLREGDKIINTKNVYKTFNEEEEQTPIFNGNIGIIKHINYEDEYMIIDFSGIGRVIVEKKFLNSIELGYAITVHKSQGSQWSHVIFGIDFSAYSLLTRELLYTGITRAKKKCDLIAQTGALRMATATESINKKTTHLQDCLYEITHPKLIF